MISKTFKKFNQTRKIFLPLVFIMVLMLVEWVGGVKAQWGPQLSQGFGIVHPSGVRGTRVDILISNPPSPNGFIAGLTAICKTSPCPPNPHFFETGWLRGSQSFGQIRHYISWRGSSGSDWKPGVKLSDATWYTFQTLHSNSANRWEGWVGGIPRLHLDFSLGFTSGESVSCGLESKYFWQSTPPGSTFCKNQQYKIGTGSWTYYNHAYEIEDDYCVRWAWSHALEAYGPGC